MGASKMGSPSVEGLMLFLGFIIVGVLANPHLLMKNENIWVTWANLTGNSNFCLSLASAQEPFKTCLIGYPLSVNDSVEALTDWINSTSWGACNCNCTKELEDKRSKGECLPHLPFYQESCRLACLIAALNVSIYDEP